MGIIEDISWVIGVINLLTKSPRPSKYIIPQYCPYRTLYNPIYPYGSSLHSNNFSLIHAF